MQQIRPVQKQLLYAFVLALVGAFGLVHGICMVCG